MAPHSASATPHRVLVATGLRAEARIVAGGDAHAVAGGGAGPRLARELEAAAKRGARAILSFGVAGGLAPGLSPGSLFVASEIVVADGARRGVDAAWSGALARALGAPLVPFVGVDEAVCGREAKRALHQATRAHLADMESHVAAAVAARLGLPFAALRAVADPAERELPHAALAAMRPGGGLDLGALARSLARDPRQIPALLHAARDARAAFRSLLRGRKLLAVGLGLPDLDELVLDVAAENELRRPLPI